MVTSSPTRGHEYPFRPRNLSWTALARTRTCDGIRVCWAGLVPGLFYDWRFVRFPLQPPTNPLSLPLVNVLIQSRSRASAQSITLCSTHRRPDRPQYCAKSGLLISVRQCGFSLKDLFDEASPKLE